MNKKLLYIMGGAFLFSSVAFAATYTLESPNKNLKVILDDGGDSLTYTLLAGDSVIVKPSEISILDKKKATVTSEKRSSVDKTWETTWGQFSKIRDNHNEMSLSLDNSGTPANLIVRLFDNGVGFRYVLDKYTPAKNTEFRLEYNLDAKDKYIHTRSARSAGAAMTLPDMTASIDKQNQRNAEKAAKAEKAAESEKESSKKTATPKKVGLAMPMPVVVEQANGKYLSLLESDLMESTDFNMLSLTYVADKKIMMGVNPLMQSKATKLVSPWRVIIVEDNLGDLLTNTVPENLATECKIDTSWIKTGKSLWDWRILGATYDGFTYHINTESYKRLIDFASDNGLEYFLMDDGWFSKASDGKMTVEKNLNYDEILAYSKKKNVGLILYYDEHKGAFGDDKLFAYYEKLGGAGMKYGFRGSNVPFTRNAISEGAKHKLLMNFHDGPVPMVGVSRTYPNAITREFCHAQQDGRSTFSPKTFVFQAQIHALQGPLDMNNGNFAIKDINALKREKGPRKANSYVTTVANECARCLIINTGFVCLPDAPEAYAAKADLFEYLKVMPVGKWDETKILHSKLCEYITTARSHKGQWFISSSSGDKAVTLPIKLDFLEAGKVYDATLYEDAPDTDAVNNPEAYQVRKIKVKKGDTIEAKLVAGGGHNIWIR